jgi:branched-chain amino acid transport system ATP-binding protein
LTLIQDINEQGTSILLVDQNAQMALAIADRAYVLETGRVTMQGTDDDLLQDSNGIKAYLGGH